MIGIGWLGILCPPHICLLYASCLPLAGENGLLLVNTPPARRGRLSASRVEDVTASFGYWRKLKRKRWGAEALIRPMGLTKPCHSGTLLSVLSPIVIFKLFNGHLVNQFKQAGAGCGFVKLLRNTIASPANSNIEFRL